MNPNNDSTPVSTENTEQNTDQAAQPEVQSLTPDAVKELLDSALAGALAPINDDISSLKRSTKKAVKQVKGETANQTQNTPDETDLNQKYDSLVLQVNGIKEADEVKLVEQLKAETNMPTEKLLASKYFQLELEELRTNRANADASSNVQGDGAGTNTKQTAAYWIAKGEYPSREQLPDKAVRKEIRAALMSKEKTQGKFYNG